MTRIPIYFMPGLAASSRIFERIKLDTSKYEVVFLEWSMPLPKENLKEYSKRIIDEKIKHENPVLIGVSFGGVIVQEIADVIPVKKVIIISSIKSNKEFPRRMRIAKMFKLYYLFPTSLIKHIELICRFPLPKKVLERIEMYRHYLSMNDKKYLDWAFKELIEWSRTKSLPGLIHIQGAKDAVFPIEYINRDTVISLPKATHIMILSRYRWLNEHLPGYIG